MKINFLKKKEVKGFAILFAVLTASLLMSIGISIFGISIKELTISTAARDSQVAFYAADSARECALYWDEKVGAFATYVSLSGSISTTTSESITCNGNIVTLPDPGSVCNSGSCTYDYTSTPFFNYFTSSPSSIPTNTLSYPQADLTIIKTFYDNGVNAYIDTLITAYGHNVGIGGGKRVERGIAQDIINNQ